MEVLSTPFGGVFTSVAIEDCKEALATNGVKIEDERMRVFHCPTVAFIGDDLERCEARLR